MGCLRSRVERQKWNDLMPAEKMRILDLCALRKEKIAAIISFIQKEYKAAGSGNLRLTKEGETDILVQKMSNFRTWYQTSSIYKIGGAQGILEEDKPADINEGIRNWLKSAKK